MKCPNCGADMPEGALYCEKCGRDIHIVPDFDPELEYNILSSINGMMEEVQKELSPWEQEEAEYIEQKYKRIRPFRLVFTAMCVCVLGLLAVGVFAGVQVYRYHSYDYQLQKAAGSIIRKDYDQAIAYYNRALELDQTDVEVAFSLAEAYMKQGNKIEYEYILRNIIKHPLANKEQLERAYGKLIAIYKERGEYEAINEILKLSDNEDIRNTYRAYMADPPVFNYEEGYYDKVVPLKLTSSTTGRIYYTMDGTEPDSSSPLYTAPILLDGEHQVIKAVFINEYGITSDVVSKEYYVELEIMEEPKISVISGDYYTPMLIEVINNSSKDVYYTTDASQPDLHSSLYTQPIPMPLGRSCFRFAYVEEDGTSSQVAVRNYNLRLNTDLTKEDAEAVVVELMLNTGKIFNLQGNYSYDSGGRYLYCYEAVINIDEEGDFYVIAEVYRDEEGVQNKTGSYYAVNAYSGECYKLQDNGNYNYSIVEINTNSQEEG